MYDSRLARQAASRPPWHSAFPSLNHYHGSPSFSVRATSPPRFIHHPLLLPPSPSSPVFTYTSDDVGRVVRTYSERTRTGRTVYACIRAFCVGECGEGHVGGGIGERRAEGTRKEIAPTSKRQNVVARAVPVRCYKSRKYSLGSEENAH